MARITLSKSAFLYNCGVYSKLIPSNKILAVLKDNAYGHGALELASICTFAGIENAAVRTANEANEISSFFKNVLVLSDDFGESRENVEFVINSIKSLHTVQKNKNIHLKIDSGMHRNGVSINELGIALDIIKDRKLNLTGVISHLKGSDELNTTQFWQEYSFNNARTLINDFCSLNNLQKPKYHIHNSAGALRKSSLQDYDYIRPGIGLYGYMDSEIINTELKPVLKIYANKVSSKVVSSAYKIGYGGFGKTNSKIVSIYDIGYGDGFWRFNEEQNYVTPNGSKLLGRVSMDSCCIEGDLDEICILDNARYAASIAKTISYDILAKLKPNIKRELVDWK